MAAKLRTKVFFEVGNVQTNARTIIDSIKTAWLNAGHMPTELNDLTLYVKAEDVKAYFVGNNGEITGYVVLSNANDLSSEVYFD